MVALMRDSYHDFDEPFVAEMLAAYGDARDFDGAQRVEIQHIQSGEIARVPSIQAALDWIGDHGLELSMGHVSHEPAGTAGGRTLRAGGAGSPELE